MSETVDQPPTPPEAPAAEQAQAQPPVEDAAEAAKQTPPPADETPGKRTFADMDLDPAVKQALDEMGYEVPMEVQEVIYEEVIAGKIQPKKAEEAEKAPAPEA